MLWREEDLPDLERIVVFRTDEVRDHEDAGRVSWSDFLATGDAIDPRLVEERAATSAEDVADLLFTSGTTGTSEGRSADPWPDDPSVHVVGRCRSVFVTATGTSSSTRTSTHSATRPGSSPA